MAIKIDASTLNGLQITSDTSGDITFSKNGTTTASITSGQLSLNLPLPVSSGGIGANSLPSGSILLGNGTSGIQTIAPGIRGTSLTSDGTNWLTINPNQLPLTLTNTQVFTANGTWTKPNNALFVYGLVIGAGGSGGVMSLASGTTYYWSAGNGGDGGFLSKMFDALDLANSVPVTVGRGGAAVTTVPGTGSAGGASSFGSYLTAYGGGGGGYMSQSTNGGGYGPFGGAGGTASAGATAISGPFGTASAGANGSLLSNPIYYAYPQIIYGRAADYISANASFSYPGNASKKVVVQNFGSTAEYEGNYLGRAGAFIYWTYNASPGYMYGSGGYLGGYYYSNSTFVGYFNSDPSPNAVANNSYNNGWSFYYGVPGGAYANNGTTIQSIPGTAGGVGRGGGAASNATSGKGGDGIVYVWTLG